MKNFVLVPSPKKQSLEESRALEDSCKIVSLREELGRAWDYAKELEYKV